MVSYNEVFQMMFALVVPAIVIIGVVVFMIFALLKTNKKKTSNQAVETSKPAKKSAIKVLITFCFILVILALAITAIGSGILMHLLSNGTITVNDITSSLSFVEQMFPQGQETMLTFVIGAFVGFMIGEAYTALLFKSK